MFGKIFKIDIKTKKYTMISMGHRNPQGLHFDKKNNIPNMTHIIPALMKEESNSSNMN